jgi:hypothetical protein
VTPVARSPSNFRLDTRYIYMSPLHLHTEEIAIVVYPNPMSGIAEQVMPTRCVIQTGMYDDEHERPT